jgi:hypothetical protein
MSRKESNVPVVSRLQACDVAHEVGHAPRALGLRCFDCCRHDVDAYGFPSPPREFGGELATATAEVKRTAERSAAPSLLAVEQSRDAGRGRLSVTLPGRDPEAVRADVVRHTRGLLTPMFPPGQMNLAVAAGCGPEPRLAQEGGQAAECNVFNREIYRP